MKAMKTKLITNWFPFLTLENVIFDQVTPNYAGSTTVVEMRSKLLEYDLDLDLKRFTSMGKDMKNRMREIVDGPFIS